MAVLNFAPNNPCFKTLPKDSKQIQTDCPKNYNNLLTVATCQVSAKLLVVTKVTLSSELFATSASATTSAEAFLSAGVSKVSEASVSH